MFIYVGSVHLGRDSRSFSEKPALCYMSRTTRFRTRYRIISSQSLLIYFLIFWINMSYKVTKLFIMRISGIQCPNTNPLACTHFSPTSPVLQRFSMLQTLCHVSAPTCLHQCHIVWLLTLDIVYSPTMFLYNHNMIILYLSLSIWLTSLNIILPRSIHIAVNCMDLSFLTALFHCVCKYTILSLSNCLFSGTQVAYII